MDLKSKGVYKSRKGALYKIFYASVFVLLIKINGITGRKEIDQIAESNRAHLYEANHNFNNYHAPHDDHHEQYFELNPNKNSHYHPHPDELSQNNGKYRFVVKKKQPQLYKEVDYYTLEHPQSTPSKPQYYSQNQKQFRTQNQPIYYSTPPPREEEYQTPQPEEKKYAFAYAVRPKDGYSGDDYSHKESRDGKVTMGEYKVLLPDGRLQVVRYTADAKAGFKADVTYEDDGQNHTPDHTQLSKPISKPSSAILKQYAPPPTPTPSQQSPYKTNPIFIKNSHPSLSPSYIYNQAGSQEHINLDPHRYLDNRNYNSQPSPTPPELFYKISPTKYALKTPSYKSSQNYKSYPSPSSYYKNPSTTPRSIYDKIGTALPTPPQSPFSTIKRGQRAGPATYEHIPLYKSNNISPTPYYEKIPTYKISPSLSPKYSQNEADFSNKNGPSFEKSGKRIIRLKKVETEPYEAPKSLKPKLLPIDFLRAGPKRSNEPQFYEVHSGEAHDFSHEPHYVLHEPLLEEPHEEEIVNLNIPPVKSSLATYTQSIGLDGTAQKSNFFIKSKELVPVGRPIKPSVGGLVYLETPGRGIRPNALGVKELLDRLPHDNLARTTTHPYEAGAKDYGKNVGYSPEKRTKKLFSPSQQIPSEYLPKLDTHRFRGHSREFLADEKDEVVGYDKKKRELGNKE